MASLYSHGVFIICIAITIVYALAASDDKFVEASCSTTSIRRVCDATLSPDSCYNHFNSMIESNVIQSQVILKNLIKSAMDQLSRTSPDFAVNGAIETLINNSKPSNRLALSALGSCRELLSLAMDNLNKSLSSGVKTVEEQGNLRAWLCATGTDLQTCVDGFDDLVHGVRNLVFEKLESVIHLTGNSSTIMALIDSCARPLVYPSKTDLLDQDPSARSRDHFPHWLSSKDRRLLQDPKITPNVVVAKDGSGNYTTVSDAIKAAPRSSQKRFVIYVKSGMYHENVKVEINQWNVMIFGDGMNLTIVYSNLSHGGGASTYNSATFTALGEGFIARDMRFMNTAGAISEQAVALLTAADRSVFYRCRIDGYQDTLYAHSNRQFYRECHIYGTIDFIFGGAAVVIQKSFIYARKPLQGQQNAIAAHYKTEPQCPTGIVVQSSAIQSSGNLTGVSTFLGRPWTSFATTVFMQNVIGRFIDPKGWFPWDNSPGAPPPASTIFLAEYGNAGNGADTANRVKWQGVRVNLSSAEASKFTVKALIQGDQWIPATNIVYEPGL